MLNTLIYGLVFLGAALMVYNICGFFSFAAYVRSRKIFQEKYAILHVPVILLILFLLGYIAVGLFGKPDLIVAGILFGGSVFVFIIYKLLNIITQRIIEGEAMEAKFLAADESNRAKTSFLASISHEMRTPMNVILGLDAVVLNEPDLSPETREHLEKIDLSAKHLLDLINRVLSINRIESGEFSLVSETFSLSGAMDQINAIAQTVSEEKGLAYRSSLQPEADGCYVGDVTQLKSVLLSILDNAVKYTDVPGTVTFSAELAEDGPSARKLRFTVSDTGAGIDSAFLPEVFKVFSQEDASATNRGGSGLSLALSKKIVELMDGTIDLHSEKDVGTVVTVTVPLLPAQNADAPEEAPAEQTVSLERKHVLIVEDLPENAEIVQDLLEMEGVETDHAENGQIALEMFGDSPPFSYDAILMDLRMPVMDGVEAARRIRALDRPDAKTVPIAALSANAFESDVRASLEAGMNAHMAKPADADQLYETLKKLIAQAGKAEGVETT